MIEALKDEEWLDGNTRAVVLTWTVYSVWSNA
jgi:Polycystin cation channel